MQTLIKQLVPDGLFRFLYGACSPTGEPASRWTNEKDFDSAILQPESRRLINMRIAVEIALAIMGRYHDQCISYNSDGTQHLQK